jgi:spermidine synthase
LFEPFDFIYGDAFNHYSVPFQLVTLEFFTRVRDLLRPATGLYMMNVIDTYESSRFVGALYNTMRRVFPQVYLLSRSRLSERPSSRDTFVLIGALRPLDTALLRQREGDEMRAGLPISEEELRTVQERSRGLIFTDDYAPVENLLASVE